MAAEYANAKVRDLLYGRTRIDETWTREDFMALAFAGLDQAGTSKRHQDFIAEFLAIDPNDVALTAVSL